MFDSFHDDFLFFLAEHWPLVVQDPFVCNHATIDNVRNLGTATFEKTTANYQGCLTKHWTFTYEVRLTVIATLKSTGTQVTDSSKTSAVIEVRVPVVNDKAIFSNAELGISYQPQWAHDLANDVSLVLQESMMPVAKQLQEHQNNQTWPTIAFKEPTQKRVPCQKGHPQKVPKEGCDPCDLCCQCFLKNSCEGACRSCDCLCDAAQRMSPKQFLWAFVGLSFLLLFLLM